MASLKLCAPSSQWIAGERPLCQRRCVLKAPSRRVALRPIRAGSYTDELVQTAVSPPNPLGPIFPFLIDLTPLWSIQGPCDEIPRPRTVVSIPCGPSALAVKEAAWGLARYASIAQDNGLVPIVEPEILLDGDHPIERTLEVAEKVWAEVFYYLAENNVVFEGILLKPSMVTPGAEHKARASPETIAKYTLRMLNRRVPPAVPGIMFLSGGQSEMEATLNLNAMNQDPNPWHVSFSYARALQNSVLKTWQGRPENVEAAQTALLVRAKANSLAQLGRYTAEGENEEAKAGMFQKGYTY
ncbi:hypothetical protein B296_00011148 [Ensete ventricosum]|uniref:Fructose-bisphosphate aldolase n=1 Tax=Ensete ventricosum TaxID=4639 RepID=A0A427B6Q6_ENSVE|nr:hypothetical protein B296_00011148 [Ensete ventricosum]